MRDEGYAVCVQTRGRTLMEPMKTNQTHSQQIDGALCCAHTKSKFLVAQKTVQSRNNTIECGVDN